MAGVASVMCSYSKPRLYWLISRLSRSDCSRKDLINDTYACENEKMLDDVLKREFGFRGYVMSDWSAQHSTMSAAVGLDVSKSLNDRITISV
jgi:beta-glucosidase-like glycosyl hydrolase